MRLIDADKLKKYWLPDHNRKFEADYFIHTIDSQPPAEPKPQWIPVSKRLPKELEDVLVCTKRGYVTCGCYVNDYNYRCVDNDLFLNLGDVVAWMPLPKPARLDGESE